MKTSNCALPDSFEAASDASTKWKEHVLPAVEEGKSKVRSVVMSVVRPSLKILPFWRL